MGNSAEQDVAPSVQFAALEPIWAGVDARQLRFLLILGALFNRRIHVSDTQLIDNPHLIADFTHARNEANSLYALLEKLIREGVAAVSLREANFVSSQQNLDPCHSLMDVLRSWERRSPEPTDWVTDPRVRNRRQMLTSFDEALSGSNARTLAYDYVDIKQDFMSQVRHEFATSGTALNRLLSKQKSELRLEYEQTVARAWFTHSTTYALLRREGLSLDDPLMQLHGLFDEVAYAHWHQIDLFGSDWSAETPGLPEQVLNVSTMDSLGAELPIEELMRSAHRIAKCPAPELIAQLNFEEVLSLREQASDLFTLQANLKNSRGNPAAEEKSLAEALANYWEIISEHVQRTRPNQTTSLANIGIFSRSDFPRATHYAQQCLTVGLTVEKVTTGKSTPVCLESAFFTNKDKQQQPGPIPHRSWFAPDFRSRP